MGVDDGDRARERQKAGVSSRGLAACHSKVQQVYGWAFCMDHILCSFAARLSVWCDGDIRGEMESRKMDKA